MLKLVNLKKDYKLKDCPDVHALKGITLNFRRNEFVAILGPSGCGKTTLLNLIGGLDRYSDGDLIIEGKSTKNYGDRDWDTYRNHSIGFVFQAYNLISHQTILKNVELALTISGISKSERKQRAMDALDKVGLQGLYNKKPNQLSGGQMQRVAIARSLVNNPEILLADEPTGALDSETSIQIMDLLKEVARDRLVIMVTHNPELAHQYATRIVSMKDGMLMNDTKPYGGESEADLKAALAAKAQIIEDKGKGKSSMSFFTATGLSFSNLVSKLKRTILVTIAGSIGIIGVSAVLAVKQGVNNYVDRMQEDMLSSYPVTISEKDVDYASLLAGLSSWDVNQAAKIDLTNKVAVDSMIKYLMSKYQDITSVKTNEINADLLEFIQAMPKEYLSSIDYDYSVDLSNNIYTEWKKDSETPLKNMSINGLTQMYVAELKTVQGFAEYAVYVDLLTEVMHQLPGDQNYILQQYDLVGEDSRFPQNENEMILVVDKKQSLTDICLAQLGYFNQEQFLNIAQYALEDNKDTSKMSKEELAEHERKLAELSYPESFEISEILGKKFKYCKHDDQFTFVERKYKGVTFKMKDVAFGDYELNLDFSLALDEATGTKLSGTVDSGTTLGEFPVELTLATPKVEGDPVKGTWMGTIESSFGDIPFGITFSSRDEGKATVMGYGEYPYTFGNLDYSGFTYSAEATSEVLNHSTDMKIVGILKAKDETQFGCLTTGLYYRNELTTKYCADNIHSQIVEDSNYGLKAFLESGNAKNSLYKAYVQFDFDSFKNYLSEETPGMIIPKTAIASCLNLTSIGALGSLLGTSSSYDEYNEAYMRRLCGVAAKQYQIDELHVGYKYELTPRTISFYPKDFATKDKVTRYLDQWNSKGDIVVNDRIIKVEDRTELTYVDTIGLIISVINKLIDAISIALIAFTSLSLVVSCFMIAVITYISTMERIKEIGVIRSLGGRKKDVSRLFIAETMIIGLASGVFGILITEGICAILNAIIAPYGIGTIAILMPLTILFMVVLSVVLNVLSGLIPSMRASRQDPVIALRSE